MGIKGGRQMEKREGRSGEGEMIRKASVMSRRIYISPF